ncbi:MAG: nucleotidyl transferase AbiEii/AbiGii toxin family protein [Dehalococcoidia bacterium]|nr:nucleotidyl transferase AbiEii/AbiGii toxin family protein [Dehalococcoidia bacterium]MYA54200.1 nucleotidyl transferase AbiEii/AbiGii toxin family protein [Dehalococcoidia bacterium]
MSPDRPRNLAASVRQRLLNRARERREDFNYLLTRYANERLLFRLAESAHRDQFVLKGATLFELWHDAVHRATRDVDLLGFGEPAVEQMQATFRELCTLDVEPDGLEFLEESVRAERIRDGQAYGGVRVRLTADLDGARIAIQVDIGFGDTVTPGVVEAEFPTLLDFPAPRLRTYPRETVVAEKFEAMTRLGIANTRMKDFYDIWAMATTLEFSGEPLAAALAATFQRRGTALPFEPPVALRPDFSADPDKQSQWSAFSQRVAGPPGVPLQAVIEMLGRFLLPPAYAAGSGASFNQEWPAGGDWQTG